MGTHKKLVHTNSLASLLSGGTLLLASAPANAAVVYSGLQNIDLFRPATEGQENTQPVQLIPGQPVDFGWLYDNSDVSRLGVGFSTKQTSTAYQFVTNPAGPFAAGSTPSFQSVGSSEVKLQRCNYPELSNCTGNWAGGEGYEAFRFGSTATNTFQYGWVRIDMPADFSDPNARARLVDWGYETDVNVEIAMGAGNPQSQSVPGPVPLAGAAAAFAASRRLRCRIKQHPEAES